MPTSACHDADLIRASTCCISACLYLMLVLVNLIRYRQAPCDGAGQAHLVLSLISKTGVYLTDSPPEPAARHRILQNCLCMLPPAGEAILCLLLGPLQLAHDAATCIYTPCRFRASSLVQRVAVKSANSMQISSQGCSSVLINSQVDSLPYKGLSYCRVFAHAWSMSGLEPGMAFARAIPAANHVKSCTKACPSMSNFRCL